MAKYPDQPMPLLESDAEGQWRINSQAQTVLNGIEQQVSVVAIVGKYRTGKSYLMNRLVGRNTGFGLGSTIQSKTKGIWMLPTVHPTDPSRCLLLLDTEGLYDVEKGDTTHDVQLFTFALLLSGCLVFNTVGSIDNAFVQELELVAELTDNIKVKATTEREDGTYFATYFPALFVVLRDFFLKLELEGKPITADEYLENSLKSRRGQSKKDQAYNAPRECIRAFFPSRKCFALPKPVQDDDHLRDLDNPAVQITTNFLEKCQEAVNSILHSVKPMNLNGNPIYGPGFLHLLEEYVRTINGGGIPCIEAAVNVLKEREYQRALDTALQTYTEEMPNAIGGKFPMSNARLLDLHTDTRDRAVDVFRKISVFEETGTSYVQKLQEMIEEQYQEFLSANNTASSKLSREAIDTCFAHMHQANRDGKFAVEGGYAEFNRLKEEAIAKYNDIPDLGPMGEEELQKFLESIEQFERAIITSDKALGEKAKVEAEMRLTIEQQEERERLFKEEKEELREQNERQRNEHLQLVGTMKNDFEKRQEQMRRDQDEAIKASEAEYRSMMEQGLQRQAEQQEMLLDAMREDKERQDEQIKKTLLQMEKYQEDMMEVFKQQAQEERSRINELQLTQREDMKRNNERLHEEKLHTIRFGSKSECQDLALEVLKTAAEIFVPVLLKPKSPPSKQDAL